MARKDEADKQNQQSFIWGVIDKELGITAERRERESKHDRLQKEAQAAKQLREEKEGELNQVVFSQWSPAENAMLDNRVLSSLFGQERRSK